MQALKSKRLKTSLLLIAVGAVIISGIAFIMSDEIKRSVRDGFGGDDALPKNVTIAPSLFDGIKLPAREFLDSGDNAVILTGIKVLEKKLESLNKEYATLITKHKKFKPAML